MTRQEHHDAGNLGHLSDAASRAGGIALCGRDLGTLGPGSGSRNCMWCADAARRLDPETDGYRMPSSSGKRKRGDA